MNNNNIINLIDFVYEYKKASLKSEDKLSLNDYSFHCYQHDLENKFTDNKFIIINEELENSFLRIKRLSLPLPPILEEEILKKIDLNLLPEDNYQKLTLGETMMFQKYNEQLDIYNQEKKIIQPKIDFYNQVYLLISEINLENKQAYLGIGQIIGNLKEKVVNHPLFSFKIAITVEGKGDIVFKISEDTAYLSDHILFNLDKSFNHYFAEIKEMIDKSTITPFDLSSYQHILEKIVSYMHSESFLKKDTEGKSISEFIKLKEKSAPIILTNWSIFLSDKKDHYFFEDLDLSKKYMKELDPTTDTGLLNIFSTITPKLTSPKIGVQHNFTTALKFNFDETLFFPLAYNSEQEKIVKNLLEHNKCIVQGPPGTGKTHAITNVMTHFLANENNILFTSYKSDAINALEEKLPESVKKYCLILKDFSSSEDIKKQTEGFVKNVQLIVEEFSEDKDIYLKEYKILQFKYNTLNERYAEINYDLKTLLELSNEKIEIDKKIFGFKEAFDYVKNSPFNLVRTNFDIKEFNIIRQIKWDQLINANKQIMSKGLIFNNIDSKLINHNFIMFPEEIISKYEKKLICLDEFNKTIEETLKNINEKLDISELEELSMNLRVVLDKYSLLLDENNKNNINKFFSQKENLKLIQKPFDFFNKNMTKVIEVFSLKINIPDSEPLETIYKKDFEYLQEFGSFSGTLQSLTKKKQKEFFSKITLNNEKINSADGWKKVKEHLIINKIVKENLSDWNSYATRFGLAPIKVEELDSDFNINKNNINIFNEISHAYFPIFSLISKSIQLNPSIFLSFQIIEKYLNAIKNKKETEKNLNDDKDALLSFIKGFYMTSKNELIEKMIIEGNLNLLKKEINKRLEEELVFKSFKNSYVFISQLLNAVKKVECKDTLSFINDILEHGYKLLIPPTEIIDSIRKTILNNFINKSKDATLIDNLMYEKAKANSEIRLISNKIIENRIKNFVAKSFSDDQSLMTLETIKNLIGKIGKGTGKKAVTYNLEIASMLGSIREKMPCMIMPHEHVAKYFKGKVGAFDLLIIDEASQSESSYINILLKGKKILVVGDNKQVSPEAIFSHDEFIKIKNKHLTNLPQSISAIMTEDTSVYDLAANLLIKQKVLMKEHFRCHPAIIEFSNKQYYDDEIICIKKSAKTELSPLIDVKIENGQRKEGGMADVNTQEAHFIVNEIKELTANSSFSKSIAVISLLGSKQDRFIRDLLINKLGANIVDKHEIIVGTPKEMQGKERDIVFLSLVVSPEKNTAASRVQDAQRFNVACSRAKETMYLVRSVEISDLSSKDENRIGLINHFMNPFPAQNKKIQSLRELCESPFELEVYDYLVSRNYNVQPQFKQGKHRIDMVVYDFNASLAIECDGDRYHNEYNWQEDIQRQGILERAGWKFWRTLYSQFSLNKELVLGGLLKKINEMNIKPAPSVESVNEELVTRKKIFIKIDEVV